MRLLHTADWQLGCRFAQFGEKAELLRGARLKTLQRSLDLARQRNVDAFIIAGDLFDDNRVDDAVVSAAVEVFAAYPEVRIFIVPGNHDPFIGPGSVWNRKSFLDAPPNVHVFRETGFVELEGGFLLASPLQQKKSTIDPSLKLDEIAKTLPPERVQVGITHGSLAIPSLHSPGAFPVALDAATRAGLDYLALGDWHNWQIYDQGRLVMPGTPEPDSFEQTASGFVACAVISDRAAPPRVEQVRVSHCQWHTFDFDYLNAEAARTLLEQAVAALEGTADSSVIRVRLRGSAAREDSLSTSQWLHERLKPFPLAQWHDESSLALSPAELEFLKANHPILAQVLADLDQIAAFTTGVPQENPGADPLSPAAADELLDRAHLDKTILMAAHFELARRMLLEKLQNAT
jgi:DNA repair exonuclease SbcCD nuclease subunit